MYINSTWKYVHAEYNIVKPDCQLCFTCIKINYYGTKYTILCNVNNDNTNFRILGDVLMNQMMVWNKWIYMRHVSYNLFFVNLGNTTIKCVAIPAKNIWAKW